MSDYSQIAQEAACLDTKFPPVFREEFEFPTFSTLGLDPIDSEGGNKRSIYLCGNSLGLMPKKTRLDLNKELDAWAGRAVVAHHNHPTAEPWLTIDEPPIPQLALLLGALDKEVAIMGSLTNNLNGLFVTFYQPTTTRYKILYERKAFPSDIYAFQFQAKLRGLDPKDALIPLESRKDEFKIRTEDILKTIDEEGDTIALMCFPAVQYYSGQFFDIPTITAHAKSKGITVAWDLAHAVGNVPLKLHEWGVDFAALCTYKYLNSGPGSTGGIFVHEKHIDKNLPRLAGWWGNKVQTRFQMNEEFDPEPNALGFRQSNANVVSVSCLRTSLDIFNRAGIQNLREKSIEMTNFMFNKLTLSKFFVPLKEIEKAEQSKTPCFTIITPNSTSERGAQLSLLFFPSVNPAAPKDCVMEKTFNYLMKNGIIGDERRPDVIRLAPLPLYNTFAEIVDAIRVLDESLELLS